MEKFKILPILIVLILTLLLTGYSNAEQNENVYENCGTIKYDIKNIYKYEYPDGETTIDLCVDMWEVVDERIKTPKFKIELVSEDNTIIKECYKEWDSCYTRDDYGETDTYNIVIDLNEIIMEKNYYLRIINTNPENTNQNKEERMILKDKYLGDYKGFKIDIQDNKLTFNKQPYLGTIDCDLWNLRAYQNNNKNYIEGNVDIRLLIGEGVAQLTTLPKIQLVSTDGTKTMDAYVRYNGGPKGLEYYFNFDMSGVDVTKQYNLVMTDSYTYNISELKSQNVYIINQMIGKCLEYNVKVQDCKIYFDLDYYDGKIDCDLWYLRAYQNNNKNYIEGNVDIRLLIGEGVAQLTTLPKIQLVSTDGTKTIDAYVRYNGGPKGLEYYFNFDIDGIDISKKYNLVMTDTYILNNGESKSQNVYIIDEKIGTYLEYDVMIKNCELYIGFDYYDGKIDCDLWYLRAYQNNNKNYIEGNVDIRLLIGEGVAQLTTLPKIQLVSTDGTKTIDAYVRYNGGPKGLEYYFNFDIDGIDTSKKYDLVMTDTYFLNSGESKSQKVYIIDEKIGRYYEYAVMIKDCKMYFEIDYYDGKIDCDLWYLRAYQNNNKNYIEGNVDIRLLIGEGVAQLTALPKIQLVSTDGTKTIDAYVRYNGGLKGLEYYFNFDIGGIDISKEYNLVMTDEYICNNGESKSQKVYIIDEKIGSYLDYFVMIKNCKIYFPKKFFFGIDVSSHNGLINWNQVAKTQDFAIIRVGYRGYETGRVVPDKNFLTNIMNAQSSGLKLGIYFFTQAINEQEAIEEANWVADMISRYNITYPVFVDTEFSNSKEDGRADKISVEQRTKNIKAFVDTIQSRGYKGGIYASKYWFKDQLDENQLNNYDKWVAHYTGDINNKTDYDKPYTMWQYTSSGYVEGVNGKVDQNICYKEY